MHSDAERIVSECQSNAQNKAIFDHKQKLQLFPAAEPLVSVNMNVYEPFSKTTQNNQ